MLAQGWLAGFFWLLCRIYERKALSSSKRRQLGDLGESVNGWHLARPTSAHLSDLAGIANICRFPD